jgi:hypothetical protein
MPLGTKNPPFGAPTVRLLMICIMIAEGNGPG